MVATPGFGRAAAKGRRALEARIELTWRSPTARSWPRWITLLIGLVLVITLCSAGVPLAVLGLLVGDQDGDCGNLGTDDAAVADSDDAATGRESIAERAGSEL